MKIRLVPFNIYLLLVLVTVFAGCKTSEEREKAKEASTLYLFLDNKSAGLGHAGGVPVYRESPVYYHVEREPFLTEADLDNAEVVEARGGFAIRAQFNAHAAMVLESTTVAHMGQHIVIKSDFGESRWLAAPLISRRIPNGELTFTPDATRDEADRIVQGLNNVIKKLKKKNNSFWGV